MGRKANIIKVFLSKEKKNAKYTKWFAYTQGDRRLVLSYQHKTKKVVIGKMNDVLNKLGLTPEWIVRLEV